MDLMQMIDKLRAKREARLAEKAKAKAKPQAPLYGTPPKQGSRLKSSANASPSDGDSIRATTSSPPSGSLPAVVEDEVPTQAGFAHGKPPRRARRALVRTTSEISDVEMSAASKVVTRTKVISPSKASPSSGRSPGKSVPTPKSARRRRVLQAAKAAKVAKSPKASRNAKSSKSPKTPKSPQTPGTSNPRKRRHPAAGLPASSEEPNNPPSDPDVSPDYEAESTDLNIMCCDDLSQTGNIVDILREAREAFVEMRSHNEGFQADSPTWSEFKRDHLHDYGWVLVDGVWMQSHADGNDAAAAHADEDEGFIDINMADSDEDEDEGDSSSGSDV